MGLDPQASDQFGGLDADVPRRDRAVYWSSDLVDRLR